jgi:hypothetical protein
VKMDPFTPDVASCDVVPRTKNFNSQGSCRWWMPDFDLLDCKT